MTDLKNEHHFPKDFVWGVATAAFQIEGAGQADGKGPSIWDTFCKVPGVIADSSDGMIACDHYNRMISDVDLIQSLGVNAYRFSMSWPRVQPLGYAAWNEPGFDFYERLVDALLARGIQPSLTLNHWDLPEGLQQMGGWANRDTVHRFVDYAVQVVRRFGDRLQMITTHNEPWVVAQLGHEAGIFAPGIKSTATAAQVSHHLLLSHGLALQAMRAEAQRVQYGIVLNLAPMHAATDSAADKAKTRLEDGKLLRWYLDALLKGAYPEDVIAALGTNAPQVKAGDMALIAQPLDFLGINYYSRQVVSADGPWDVAQSGLPLTDMRWEVYPEGLTELLVRIDQDYNAPPIFITENGAAFPDQVVDGAINDVARTDYLTRHIAAVGNAMAQGVRVAGYMVWSSMDNFEWASGYVKRFGIVHVDYATQKRTLKASGQWYQQFLARQKARPSVSQVPATADIEG